jgi:hypothetical protein
MKTIVFEFGLVGLWCLMPHTTIFQLLVGFSLKEFSETEVHILINWQDEGIP